jgi:small-conductance mechanosensitive channel
MTDHDARSRLIRRLRQQLSDALRYAQAGAEKLASCEQELVQVRRTARATREALEARIMTLQARIDELEGRPQQA